jgi:hypothetical protein
MRKLLSALLIVIVLAALWLWRGRDLSTLVDRFRTIEAGTRPITEITYEGGGTGGVLRVDDVDLSFNQAELGGATPSMGTTKDGQLALSFAGKVFPFGPVQDDKLAAKLSDGDAAKISIGHSVVAWPNFFEINFMTGNSPKWKRHIYQRLVWKKANGARLEMVWRYEQFYFAGNGWTDALMTRAGSTGLIRVEISGTSR